MFNTLPFIQPKQSLGQNFLIDNNIAEKFVRGLKLQKGDVIIEIGPGRGALTTHIAGHVRHLILVEIDGRIIKNLQRKFASRSVTILHKDFLDLSLSQLQRKHKNKFHIVGNIPYHLTSPILFKIFDEAPSVRHLTFMVQREVARRMNASPGSKEYGILSVLSHFYGEPSLLFNVSPNCFYPKPKVTSTVVRLSLHENPQQEVNDNLFRTVVRTTFGKRRKTLRNSLKYLPYEKSVIDRCIKESPISMEKRPEQLTMRHFIALTKHLETVCR